LPREEGLSRLNSLALLWYLRPDSYIDLSNLAMPDAFRKATGYIYSWVKSRYEDVFTDLPESAETYVKVSHPQVLSD